MVDFRSAFLGHGLHGFNPCNPWQSTVVLLNPFPKTLEFAATKSKVNGIHNEGKWYQAFVNSLFTVLQIPSGFAFCNSCGNNLSGQF